MAHDVPALKMVSLELKDDREKDENVGHAISRRNPLLRYDQMCVFTLNISLSRALPLILSKDMICTYLRSSTGYRAVT